MSGYRRLLTALRPTGHRLREETDAEIDAHVDMRVADLVAEGMSPAAARAEAERRFGEMRQARRRLYEGAEARNDDLRRRDRIGALKSDIVFAIRQARRAPAFTAIVVATLAIGIGLTTTMMTLAERNLLRPLPFPQDHQLVSLGSMDSTKGGFARVSAASWRAWTAGSRTLESTAITQEMQLTILDSDGAITVPSQVVTPQFFRVLRPRFVVGRGIDTTDLTSGEPVAVVSEAFWRRVFHADRSLSASVRTAARSFRVVGVVADGHEYPAGAELWLPTRASDPGPNNINYRAIGRLSEGTSIEQAKAELDLRAHAFRESTPSALYSWGVDVQSLKQLTVGEADRYLRLLMLASALVLLVACANVAAANLGRGSARMREMAVRAAIGAGRGRLIQQLLVEHIAVGIVAGALGLGLAWASLRLMIDRWGSQLPRVAEVALDPVILVAALAVSIIAGVATGILPAIAGSRASVLSLMSGSSRGFAGGGKGIPTQSLVAAQIATAVVLVTASTMLLRSFSKLLDRGLGFDPAVVTAEAILTSPVYRTDTSRAFAYWAEQRRRLGALPGVEVVGMTNRAPLISGGKGFIEIEGSSAPNSGAGYRVIDDQYFSAMRIPLLRGRDFSPNDRLGSERVAIINEAMARRFWPGGNALGKRVKALSMEPSFTREPVPWIRIVGIAGDVRHYGLDDDIESEMFVHAPQVPLWAFAMTMIVRPTLDPQLIASSVRDPARLVDRSVAVKVSTLQHAFREDLAERTMIMSLVSMYGVVALLLAALGTYGMLAYAVARRTRELAVRTALGARRSALVRLVMGGAVRVAAAGMVAGVAGSLAAARLLESNLVEISMHDTVSIIAGAAVLGVAALIAALPPVLRATRIDPLVALREE